jgi:hypothetical protein
VSENLSETKDDADCLDMSDASATQKTSKSTMLEFILSERVRIRKMRCISEEVDFIINSHYLDPRVT